MDELTSGLQSVRKSKLEFEQALASINGTQLHTHELEVYRLGFQDDLNRINGFAADIAAIFSTAIQGEVSGHVKAVDALRNAPIKSTGVTLQERVREFSADAKSLQDGWLISVREGRLGQMAFSLSGFWDFVILPPLQLAFLVFAWRSLRKFKPAPARAG